MLALVFPSAGAGLGAGPGAGALLEQGVADAGLATAPVDRPISCRVPFFFDLRGATGDPVRIGFLRNQGEKKATEVCRARLPVTRPVPMPS